MCQECGAIHGHATPCSMNPDCALDEPELVVCPLCEREVPDDQCLWGACDECIAQASTFENALAYGADRKVSVEINGFLAYAFSPSDIEDALTALLEMGKILLPDKVTDNIPYLTDDTSDFADWLKERKEKSK